jgi:S1-C subfamily serine protease
LKRVVRVLVIALLALAILGNGTLAAALVATREPAPKPLDAERVATASKPAIALIESSYTIAVSIPTPTVTEATKNVIQNRLQPLVNSGQITTQAQWEHAWYQLIINNPDSYFSPGAAYTDTWYDTVTGSGFFVTEDGYLVTAAHVVTASKRDELDGIVAETKDPTWVNQEKDQIKKDWARYGPSDAEVNKMVDFNQRWIANHLSVDRIDARFSIGSGASVDTGETAVRGGIAASVVSVDPTQGGHDIAIMKADVTKVPALSLAGRDPNMGDATYAIGYPGSASIYQQASKTDTFRITVTTGTIQRMQSETSSDGSRKVYGTDALLAHGDSGGPIVDANGNVMGVMSFIVPDATGTQLPGQGYFVPSSFVKEDLAKAGVTLMADPHDLTNTYYRALAKGDIGRYKVELNLLQTIQSRATTDPYVNADISHAQSEIAQGHDTTPPNLAVYVVPASGSAVGVILLALLSWLVLGIAIGRKPKPVYAVGPEPPAEDPPAATVGAVPAD